MRSKFLFQEADFYGASKLLNWKGKQPFCYRASWMHGLGPVLFRDKVVADVLIHYYEKNLPIHLVNNNCTVSMLGKEGVDSIAVGMPFIYTAAYSANNIVKIYKKLFMPSHSIYKKNQAEDYTEWRDIMKKYGCDAICVGLNDYNNIKQNNIKFGKAKVLKGAYAADSQSLERISLMLKSTEEMITNSNGSHMVYATAAGAHVAIIDEMRERAKKRRDELGTNKNIINTIPKKQQNSFARHLSISVVDDVIEFWESNDEKEKVEYSEFLLGVKEKKAASEVANYLTPNSALQKIEIAMKQLNLRVRKKMGC